MKNKEDLDMKKLLCVLLVLVLLPVVSLADPRLITSHYAFFMDDESSRGPKGEKVIDYDSLCLDLFILEGGSECYLTSVRSFSGIVITGTSNMSIAERDGLLYLADQSGLYLAAYYDENGEDIWLQYENHYFRLRPVPVFNLYTDMI